MAADDAGDGDGEDGDSPPRPRAATAGGVAMPGYRAVFTDRTEDRVDGPRDNGSGAGRGAGVDSSSSSRGGVLEVPRVQVRVMCGIWRRFDGGF